MANDELHGLPSEKVKRLRALHGENRLPREKGVSPWRILLNQILSPLVYIILAAAVVSLVLREFGDFAIIMVVVAADVILGFIQEYQSQRTYVALKGLLNPTTTVLRDGERKEVEVWELVPGDLVLLNAGEKVPADGELAEAMKLTVEEAILTGESEPIAKECGSPVLMGTTVLTGRGTMRVAKTGMATELGAIAASLGGQTEEKTPFQIRLKAFSKVLTWIVVGFTAVILAVGMVMGGKFFDMLRTAIILAIAAVPEGLLIAVTVILVLGMRRILKRKGLVKRLLAVETLGSVTVICTDKTGTLTEGSMRVTRDELDDRERALQTMVFCNNLEGPVEAALWQFAERELDAGPQAMAERSARIAEELFSSETKFMITHVTGGHFGEDKLFFLKGAPEIVMAMCDLPDGRREGLMARVDEWADAGLRLLGLAWRQNGTLEDRTGYRWVGLVGMEDPIREDVVEAIRVARHAGIRVIMITGDYRRTAKRIGDSIGLLTADEYVLEGEELAAMSDEALREEVGHTNVFARIRPQDKLRIVGALQADGEITAMIGDGVNDAPALKRANIGVVVGSATDVAKENADLILLDSKFSTIVTAIEEGRVIFTNIRKVVAYTLSNSFAEVLTIFIAMILGWPAPLIVAQILWIHLICDGPADIVLGFEPKEAGIMDEKPRKLKEPVLTRLAVTLIGVISVASTIFVLFLFRYFTQYHGDVIEGRSVVFASLAINSMVYIFAYRSMKHPLHRMNPLNANPKLIGSVLLGLGTVALAFLVPGLRTLLGLVPLNLLEWGLVIGFALLLLGIVEIGKAVANRLRKEGKES